MKFCLLTSFPASYLEDFYLACPELGSADFKALSSRLAVSFPEGAQQWAQPLMDAGHRVQVIIANDRVSQRAWLAEKLPDFKPTSAANETQEVVIEQLRKLKPDVLCIFDPLTFDDAFIKQLKGRPKWIVGYAAELSPNQGTLRGYDLFLTPCASCAESAQHFGVRDARVFEAAFSRAAAEEVFQTSETIDVFFCGPWPAKDGKRTKLIECLAQSAARKDRPFNLALHLETPVGAVVSPTMAPFIRSVEIGRERWKSIRGSAIVVADVLEEDVVPMSVYESTGIGALTFTEDRPCLSDVFKPNEEVVAYKDLAELVSKIDLFLQRSDDRLRIAKAGQERCLTAFSIEARVAEFVEMVAGEPPTALSSARPWWRFWR